MGHGYDVLYVGKHQGVTTHTLLGIYSKEILKNQQKKVQ